MNILHLSQTDIKSDSRILKEMQSILECTTDSNIYGIGVKMNESTEKVKELSGLKIDSITLKSRQLDKLPTVIIHILSVIEIVFKMFFKALKIKPRVIHCHDTPVLPLGIMIKIFTNAKLIYDAHELESDRNGISKLSGRLTKFIEKLLWRFVDALIVVSPSIDKWYIENIGDKYSEVILNSPVLEKDVFSADPKYLRRHFSISGDSKIFLYIGILGQGRGIDLITEVFKKFDLKSSLVFLGYGELSNELKKLSEVHQNIYVHDAVSHNKVVSIARSADVGLCLIQNVSLSDYYCLPNKLFEYAFSEIPILASNFPDISEVVNKYNLGICSELNEKSVYTAIKKFEEMNELPKIDANDLYELSWGAQEKKLIKLYEKLIKEVK